jgi:hypothetical protein
MTAKKKTDAVLIAEQVSGYEQLIDALARLRARAFEDEIHLGDVSVSGRIALVYRGGTHRLVVEIT